MAHRFFEDIKASVAIATSDGAAGAAEIDGAGLDMTGYDAVAVVVQFGAIVAGAATSIKAQQSSDDGSSDAYSDIEGTSQTVADDADDTVFCIDMMKPTKRYVRVVVLRATQNSTVGGAMYYQYQTRHRPPTQGTGVNVEGFASAAEGTA